MTLDVKIDPLGLPYRTVIRPDQYEDGTIAYIAEMPELPGCRSHGATVEEALSNLADAQREYLESLNERSLPIPTPSPDPIATAGGGSGRSGPAQCSPYPRHDTQHEAAGGESP